MSYNVRHCRGMDGIVSLERVAEVICGAGADLVALQEVDLCRARTGRVDQAARLAELTGMTAVFGETMRLSPGAYGNAVLSRVPMTLIAATPLPTLPGHPALEPRGVMEVRVALEDQSELRLVNTHLGLRRAERALQISALLKSEDETCHRTILCGDFNCGPISRPFRLACTRLRDAGAGSRRLATWPSRWPVLRLDHVLVGSGLHTLSARTVRSEMARRASDHLPIVVTVQVEGA